MSTYNNLNSFGMSWVTSRVVCKIDYGVQTPILIQVMEHRKDYSL